MFLELGCSGQSSTVRFHGLSGGNTSRAEQIASASGVLNSTGPPIFGIVAARTRASRAGSPRTPAGAGAAPEPTGNGVTVRSTSIPPTLPLILYPTSGLGP